MKRLLLGWLAAPLVLAACITIEVPVEVEPESVPAEIEGARWPNPPVPYCIVRDPEGGFADHETLVALTQEAMEHWGVPTLYEGDCPGPLETNNGRNEIAWGDLPDAGAFLSKAGSTNLRYLTRVLNGDTEITEADIVINRTPPAGKDSTECLFSTLLHEAGHFFGLFHLEAGVMSPVITECYQELTPADREAMDALYNPE